MAKDKSLSDKKDCLYTFTVCEFLSFKFLLGRLKRRSATLRTFPVQRETEKEIALNLPFSPDRRRMKDR